MAFRRSCPGAECDRSDGTCLPQKAAGALAREAAVRSFRKWTNAGRSGLHSQTAEIRAGHDREAKTRRRPSWAIMGLHPSLGSRAKRPLSGGRASTRGWPQKASAADVCFRPGGERRCQRSWSVDGGAG